MRQVATMCTPIEYTLPSAQFESISQTASPPVQPFL